MPEKLYVTYNDVSACPGFYPATERAAVPRVDDEFTMRGDEASELAHFGDF